MSWFNLRNLLLLPLLVVAAACKFTPVYAPGEIGAALYGKIEIQEPDDTSTYELVRNFEDRMGRPNPASYELKYKLKIQDQGQAITDAGEITRYSVVGTLEYTLTPVGSDEIIASGSVDSFTGYSATGDTAETLSAERDAYTRLMQILADKLSNRLLATVDLNA